METVLQLEGVFVLLCSACHSSLLGVPGSGIIGSSAKLIVSPQAGLVPTGKGPAPRSSSPNKAQKSKHGCNGRKATKQRGWCSLQHQKTLNTVSNSASTNDLNPSAEGSMKYAFA